VDADKTTLNAFATASKKDKTTEQKPLPFEYTTSVLSESAALATL
jgi:hypothetical protein